MSTQQTPTNDPHGKTWTPEEKKRKQLQDAMTQRDNLEKSFVGMPTTEVVVQLGEYDDVIKKLTQELGVGDKTSTQNVAAPMSAPDTKPFVPEMTEPIQRYGQSDDSGSNSDPYAIPEKRQVPFTNPYDIPEGYNPNDYVYPDEQPKVYTNPYDIPGDQTGAVEDIGVDSSQNGSNGVGVDASDDYYINQDDYENSEEYAKALLEGVRNSIDAQDLDKQLTANGYKAGAEGLAALNKYVEDELGPLGVAVYTDELNAKDEEMEQNIASISEDDGKMTWVGDLKKDLEEMSIDGEGSLGEGPERMSEEQYYYLHMGGNDEAGAIILNHYLYGDGEKVNAVGPAWTKYMADNRIFQFKMNHMLSMYARGMEVNTKHHVSGETNMEIDTGEDINGYQFLHGTDHNAGGLVYNGEIVKYRNGYIGAKITFVWNDIMNTNENYTTDDVKNILAEAITLGGAEKYEISIVWDQIFYLNESQVMPK